MGYYEPSGRFDFKGTSSEKAMMKKLLQLMSPDYEGEWDLPLDRSSAGN